MKRSVMLYSIVLTIILGLVFCDTFPDQQSISSKLIFKATISNTTNLKDTVLFTGKDIKWINLATGEIRFVDSFAISKIKKFHWIKCYQDTDSLFTATITSDIMSSIVNDLVLNLNSYDNHYYFGDGYPAWIDNLRDTNIRNQNKKNRDASWSRFIEQLKKEGRFKEEYFPM